MGNEKSKLDSSSSHASPKKTDARIETAFNRLTSGKSLKIQDLQDAFGEDFASSLWDYLSDTKSISEELSLVEFSRHAASLMGSSTDVYVVACQPIHRLIKVCSAAAGAVAVRGDEKFITSLVEEMCSAGRTPQDIIGWKQAVAPKFCNALQATVLQKCLGYDKPTNDYSSDILTPLQMWFVQCCLTPTYFPGSDSKKVQQWSPLYTSAQQGISVSRFEANVFDYRGPTVTVLQLSDGRVVVLATDQEWRHGSTRFGGPATTYIQLSPSIKKIEASSSIYCNFKLRSAVFGLSFQEDLKIDKEMSEVQSIEVWGCAGANTLAEQQRMKQWQHQQTEKNKKVPLPGNWDDNPDKTLMEMAGFNFSNERKLMEMESKH